MKVNDIFHVPTAFLSGESSWYPLDMSRGLSCRIPGGKKNSSVPAWK